jgi:hypothetical protein
MNKATKFFAIFLITICAIPLSYAGEIDLLVDKLVEKGILSAGEAKVILTETKEQMRKAKASGEVPTVPSWVNRIKLKGDYRLRYQYEDKTEGNEDRHRGRYRFRLGLEGKVNDKVKVAAGLATGGDDARSTNQTMDGGFSSENIMLDYAYMQWAAKDWMTIKSGKIKSIKKLIFRPSDLLWDSDINPEGISVQLSSVKDNTEYFLNSGVWVLDEIKGDSADSMMYVVQPGIQYKWDNAKLTLGLAGYFFSDIVGNTLDNGGDTSGSYNTTSGGGLVYEYNSYSPSMALSFKKPFGGEAINKIKFFGDYVHNPDPDQENTGWLAGIKFYIDGPAKILGKAWDLSYSYRYLEKDAWIDIFPDSDAYGGHTDIEGHEIKISYPLSNNASLGLDYYIVERIEGSGSRQVFQLDYKFKF